MAVEGESVYDRYGQAKGRSKRFTPISEGAWAGARRGVAVRSREVGVRSREVGVRSVAVDR